MSEAPSQLKCDVCGKCNGEGITIKQCGRCRSTSYCGATCQKQDWPSHKEICRARVDVAGGKMWYDQYRDCMDGSSHFGQLELITFDGIDHGEERSWGNTQPQKTAYVKRLYEEVFKSEDIQMFLYWPGSYRWTCCGVPGYEKYGCDHHGTGPKPCSCDFCHTGKPLPDRIYHGESISRQGLELARGPDPRSFDGMEAAMAKIMRPKFFMDEV